MPLFLFFVVILDISTQDSSTSTECSKRIHGSFSQNSLENNSDERVAADVSRALDSMPLAMAQTVAYIYRRAPHMSVLAYPHEFQEIDKEHGSYYRWQRMNASQGH